MNNVIAHNPNRPAVGTIVLWLLIAAVAIVGIRWLGEWRMEARHSAATVQLTASATPLPTPTPQAPRLPDGKSITLDTGFSFDADYIIQETKSGFLLTDPDGDMWSCRDMPANIEDWQSCRYAGTTQ